MRTIYTTTSNITSRTDNIVDLAEYRRTLALDQEGSLAPQPQAVDCAPCWEEEEEIPALRELPPRRASRAQRRGLLLDALASAGVLVMTLTFTLRVLVL